MGDIRKFDDAGIQEAVEKALEWVPNGKKGAVVAYATPGGVRLAVAGRLGKDWTIVGTLDHPFGGTLEGAAAVRWTWE